MVATALPRKGGHLRAWRTDTASAPSRDPRNLPCLDSLPRSNDCTVELAASLKKPVHTHTLRGERRSKLPSNLQTVDTRTQISWHHVLVWHQPLAVFETMGRNNNNLANDQESTSCWGDVCMCFSAHLTLSEIRALDSPSRPRPRCNLDGRSRSHALWACARPLHGRRGCC